MVTEIIIYKLKEGMKDVYWEAFINESLPAMKEWQIDVVDYGFSLEAPFIFHLIRSFDSLQHRNDLLNEFYKSDDWRKGPRTQIIDSIESSKTTIFERNN